MPAAVPDESPTAPAGSTTRQVSARLEAKVTEVAEIVLSIAAAVDGDQAQESLTVTLDGTPIEVDEIVSTHHTRLHVARDVPCGNLVVDYQSEVTGDLDLMEPDEARDAADRILYLRPSRYCESDTLAAVAAEEFSGLAGRDLLAAVSSWVGQQLIYLSGSSRHTDGAVQTFLSRQGVCRDYAHLVVALLRARGVPARLASVYAPGLSPMDFHAVAEAQLDDGWYVVDATTLAPRQGMLRIATGRDASDTAFLTVHSGRVDLTSMQVTATMRPELPHDDITELVHLP